MFDPRIQGFGPNLLHSLSPKTEPEKDAQGFKEALVESIAQVNQEQLKADRAIDDLAVGNRRSLHEVMIEVEKADISFRLLMAVRSKVVQAYQEIMRMRF
jgi:flagellar hook-basal body complex protein FliE